MDWLFVLEKVISWGIPVLCTAILARIAGPVKKAQEAQSKGQAVMDQEDWDEKATELRAEVAKIKETHTFDKAEIIAKIDDLKAHDEEFKETLNQILLTLQENHQRDNARLDDIDAKNTAAFVQIYQRDLIVDGKNYIRHERITPQQLANYEKRYAQYKAWGGNGDVEIWIKKIRSLPIYFPNIQTDDDK